MFKSCLFTALAGVLNGFTKLPSWQDQRPLDDRPPSFASSSWIIPTLFALSHTYVGVDAGRMKCVAGEPRYLTLPTIEDVRSSVRLPAVRTLHADLHGYRVLVSFGIMAQ